MGNIENGYLVSGMFKQPDKAGSIISILIMELFNYLFSNDIARFPLSVICHLLLWGE
jgi:hypothetical protein